MLFVAYALYHVREWRYLNIVFIASFIAPLAESAVPFSTLMIVPVPVAVDVGGGADVVAIVGGEKVDEVSPKSIEVGVSSTKMRSVEVRSVEVI